MDTLIDALRSQVIKVLILFIIISGLDGVVSRRTNLETADVPSV